MDLFLLDPIFTANTKKKLPLAPKVVTLLHLVLLTYKFHQNVLISFCPTIMDKTQSLHPYSGSKGHSPNSIQIHAQFLECSAVLALDSAHLSLYTIVLPNKPTSHSATYPQGRSHDLPRSTFLYRVPKNDRARPSLLRVCERELQVIFPGSPLVFVSLGCVGENMRQKI